VWTIPTQAFKGAHFAPYPEKLIEIPILAGCPEGGVVLDPFAGTATTSVVAARLGRRCIAIELNPEYFDMAKDRLRKEIMRRHRKCAR
jgi:DNA modification methylase